MDAWDPALRDPILRMQFEAQRRGYQTQFPAAHWQLILERTGPMDELTLECEPAAPDADRDALAHCLEQRLNEGTGVRIAVTVLEPGSVPRIEGKAVRVVDRRSE